MRHGDPGGRRFQRHLVARHLDELETSSRVAASQLIRESFVERRSGLEFELAREMDRLRRESERVDGEPALAFGASEEELTLHLARIEKQLEEVLAERDLWFRESLRGRRRRREDFRHMQRLKEESERLTAELLRCAALLCESHDVAESANLRRVRELLRRFDGRC